jgi:hypothetical protein
MDVQQYMKRWIRERMSILRAQGLWFLDPIVKFLVGQSYRPQRNRAMKAISYVTCLRKLKLMDQISGHVELLPGVNITNDPVVKRKWLTREFATVAGVIEESHLQSESNLVFGEFDADDFKDLPPDGILLVILSWIDALLESAWIITEHVMTCDAAFLRSETASEVSWSSNFLAPRPSFSVGYSIMEKDIRMTVQNLKEWSRIDDLVNGYLCERKSLSSRFMMEKGYSRSGRALRFVAAARRAPDLAFKIANYCSALETLFTTESTELAHKLSERVAFFLGERGYNRRAVFTTIKSAYGVRSKLVHGDTLKPIQTEGLPLLSSQCDVYLREILREIFSSEKLKNLFDSHNEEIEEYFAGLILGPLQQDATDQAPTWNKQ